MKTLNEMIQLFETANNSFLNDDYESLSLVLRNPLYVGHYKHILTE